MRARRKGEAHRRPAGREGEPLRGWGGSGARPKRPRGFSRGPERELSEPEARVAARLMRRDGRLSSAWIFRKPEPETYLPRSTK